MLESKTRVIILYNLILCYREKGSRKERETDNIEKILGKW